MIPSLCFTICHTPLTSPYLFLLVCFLRKVCKQEERRTRSRAGLHNLTLAHTAHIYHTQERSSTKQNGIEKRTAIPSSRTLRRHVLIYYYTCSAVEAAASVVFGLCRPTEQYCTLATPCVPVISCLSILSHHIAIAFGPSSQSLGRHTVAAPNIDAIDGNKRRRPVPTLYL